MQTFLPYPSFSESAKALDYRRLGKQRVETKQILMALRGESKGWVNHPAVKMWRGYETALAVYGMTMCKEWISRGYKDTLLQYFKDILIEGVKNDDLAYPQFSYEFHRSHQSNLIRKDPEFYGAQFSGVPDDLPYVWSAA